MTLPAPLIPAEVDLRGHEWFPFFPERLRKSKWWRRATDVARARNVMLWGEAWKSVPAGSLPDDDDELAEAAGFGMDAVAFIAAKAEIMAPWTLCSDGRWYQPTVCEQALNAWDRMDDRRKNARERQARRRARVGKGVYLPDADQARVTCDNAPVTRDMPEVTRENGIEERRGEERIDIAANGAPRGAPRAEQYPPEFIAFWNAAGDQMRRRSSRKQSFTPWQRECRACAGHAELLTCQQRYQREDEDYQRTGGPGLHQWLADRRWEHWLPKPDTAPINRDEAFWRQALTMYRDTGRWGDNSGPKPEHAGCLAPTALLDQFGFAVAAQLDVFLKDIDHIGD